MRSMLKGQKRRPVNSRLLSAASCVFEPMESRVLMSTTITDWTFDPLTIGTNLSPAPTTGTGTALTVGMQTSGSNANSPGGVYAYPNPNASGTGDISDILVGALNNGAGDYSSTGSSGDGNAWRVRGSSDGWSSNAALGSQGAQFMVSTVGDSGISLQFDLDPSSGSAASEVQVQYTTNGGSTWINATSIATGTAANGTTDGISVATNSSNPNIVNGSYFQIANNADGLFWQNELTANFSSITAANNNANFGVRIVNAATGTSEFEVGGTAFPTAGAGNWRFDNVQIIASGAGLSSPSVTQQPANVTTEAGQLVSFSAAASGNPTPTVQWQVLPFGSSTWVNDTTDSGNTTDTLSFTASSTAADNGNQYRAVFTNSQAPSGVDSNAATLTDALSAVTNVVSPTPVSVTSGNTGTFTASAYGSPAPSVQWESGPTATGPFSAVSGGTTTTSTTPTATTTSYSFTSATSQNSTYYEAVFTNSQSPSGVATSAAKLSVAGTTITAWNFNSLTVGTDLTPTPSTGTGSAVSIGMTQPGTSPGADPTTGATGPDTSNILAGTGSNGGSSDGSTGNIWRIVGTNGWNSTTAIGTQGAQFLVPTTGFTAIAAQFDLYATTQGEGKFEVEYTTNGSTWNNVPAADLSVNGDSGISVQNNTTSTNTVMGGYFDITGGQGWYNALQVNLNGVTAANNDSNFGIRVVNASTGTDCVNASGAALNNTSGNWRFDEVQISGTNLPEAPAILSSPLNASVAAGSNATFTASASGFPTPTIQWYVKTTAPGATFVPDTTDSGNTTNTLTVASTTSSENGYEYEAVYSNSSGPSATTNPATLTVTTAPVVTTQPLSQVVGAGSTVTFTAAASGVPTPTVQWEVSTNGTSFSPISGATSTTYSFTATEGLTGSEYEAVFTNTQAPSGVPSNPATLTVTGTPIAQWIFTGGEAPSAQDTAQGTGNSPYATYGPLTNVAETNGLENDYTGIQAFPESDILIERSTINPSFSEYDWRIRSGDGQGPTGSPGTPEGWSQDAPEWDQITPGEAATFEEDFGYPLQPQGVQFNVNTTGYSDITLHFDWNEGGISDMQPVYSLNGGETWTALPNSLIQQILPAGDFYGISANSAPTGITVNLQGIAGANNNPNFELQLDAEYNPSLPLISDGNELDPTVHGQYATGAPGPVDAQQVLQFNSGISNGEVFPLTYNGSTQMVTYSSTPATLITNLDTALTALVGAGNYSVSPTNYTSAAETSELDPERDGLGITTSDMTVTFKGTLADTAVATITTTDSNVVIATWVAGSTDGFEPYVDGGGAWQIGNISFNGDSTQSGGLGITANPASTSVGAGLNAATFTASAYSETTPVTAQWYVSTGGAFTAIGGATNISGTGPNYTSTYTTPGALSLSQNGTRYEVIFTAGSGTVTSLPATVTVVSPVAPAITQQPQNTSVQEGSVAVLTASATAFPAATVQWQIDLSGTWTNLTDSATYFGSQISTPSATGYVATLDITTSGTALNGDQYRAVFTNVVTSTDTSAVTLTVLTPQTVLTDWDFNALYPNVTSAGSSPDPIVDSPVPVTSGVDSSVDVGGVASAVGMDLPYNFNDPATGTDGFGAVNIDDIVNSPGSLNPNFNENTWRIRSGPDGGPGGTPANGWSNFAPEYSQGVQFSTPTTGYSDVYVTMDWYSTTSGELDAQEQYTVGGTTAAITGESISNDGIVTMTTNSSNAFKFGDEVTISGLGAAYDGTFQVISGGGGLAPGQSGFVNPDQFTYETSTYPASGQSASGSVSGSAYVPTWININNQVQAVSNDFYGATAAGGPIPLTINVSSIPGAANNPNFGIRLVNAYDPTLSNTQTLTLGDTNNFQLTINTLPNSYSAPTAQTTAMIPYSSNADTETASIEAAIGALVGSSNVSVIHGAPGVFYITYGGTLNNVAQPAIVPADSNDTIATDYQYANAALVGSPPGPAAYNGSKGNWRFDNIVVHGDPTWLSPNSQASWNAATNTLTVTGPSTIISDPGSAEPNIVASGAAAQLLIEPTTSDVGIHIGSVTLSDGAGIDVASVGADRSHSDHNTLVIGTLGAVNDPTISVDASSKINLEDNDLIVHTGSSDTTGQTELATIQALAAIGRNVAAGGIFDGTWTGNGLTSSTAASVDSAANAGYEQNILAVELYSDMLLGEPNNAWTVGSFSEPLGANDIIVKYTYNGDLALDGAVDGNAATIFSGYFPGPANDYAFGDLNGDGVIDGNDATIFSGVFGNGLPGSGLPLL